MSLLDKFKDQFVDRDEDEREEEMEEDWLAVEFEPPPLLLIT